MAFKVWQRRKNATESPDKNLQVAFGPGNQVTMAFWIAYCQTCLISTDRGVGLRRERCLRY